ncbi:MAG TPA: pilus assembly PilX N-terminal domain-containing protein [bacterium]|nr:pilus assembly PilX N-terminal domain-containing protein [bacterium]
MKTKRIKRQRQGEAGYALVASMIILMLITALGLLAMVSSSAEQVITTNLGEDQTHFFLAEQGIDRVLSHMHYLECGLFSRTYGLGYDPLQSNVDLNPKQVLENRGALHFTGGAGSNSVQSYGSLTLDAWIDPMDFEGWYDRGISRPVAINVRLTNLIKGINKAFRAYVRSDSVWDMAYYAMNSNPAVRGTSSSPENCSQSSQNWYACQSAWLNGDTILGNVYVSNTTYTPSTGFVMGEPDTARLFMRGKPRFLGQVSWRNAERFDYGDSSGSNYLNSQNQTRGGRSIDEDILPDFSRRNMRYNAKPIMMPPVTTVTDAVGSYRQAADITFAAPATGYAWKIIFRNDMDTVDTGGTKSESWVASAITHAVNVGVSPTRGVPTEEDHGTMMIYQVPLDMGNATQRMAYRRAAFYGNDIAHRHARMLSPGGAPGAVGEIWSPTHASYKDDISGKYCYDYRNLNEGTFGPANDTRDISHYFMYVPSRGQVKYTREGTCVGSGGNYSGIIFFEGGPVLVSGILDGQLTIAVAGDIYLDHEIEYENSPTIPLHTYSGFIEPDILALIATGDVIIPNSYPDKRALGEREIYADDWSDAQSDPDEYTGSLFQPTGRYDDPPYNLKDDDGSEDIQAVIMSYGLNCTLSGSSYSCSAPSTSDIRAFRVGFYATARTYNASTPYAPSYTDPPYDRDPTVAEFNSSGGNDSGKLRIVGAVIENIPGRLAYDHEFGAYASGTCSDGVSCNRIGFSEVELSYDQRLKYLPPPYPRQASSISGYQSFKVPLGYAAYYLMSWEEVDPTDAELSDGVW